MDKVIVKDNKIIHRDKIYEYENIRELRERLKSRVVFILANNLEVERYKDNEYKENKDIDKELVEGFKVDEDILIDNILDKKSKIKYIYRIRGGNFIVELIDSLAFIKVNPIQFIIKKTINKHMFMKKSYRGIIKFLREIYIIDVEENKIVNSKIISTEEFEENKEYLINEDTVIDISLKNTIERRNIKYINVAKKIERKVYGI